MNKYCIKFTTERKNSAIHCHFQTFDDRKSAVNFAKSHFKNWQVSGDTEWSITSERGNFFDTLWCVTIPEKEMKTSKFPSLESILVYYFEDAKYLKIEECRKLGVREKIMWSDLARDIATFPNILHQDGSVTFHFIMRDNLSYAAVNLGLKGEVNLKKYFTSGKTIAISPKYAFERKNNNVQD